MGARPSTGPGPAGPASTLPRVFGGGAPAPGSESEHWAHEASCSWVDSVGPEWAQRLGHDLHRAPGQGSGLVQSGGRAEKECVLLVQALG